MNKSITDINEVKIIKKTSIQGFTPEEELKYLVERGDWELVITSKAFAKRSPEGQAQVIQESIDYRIKQLGKTLNYLINQGPNERAAAMGVLQRRKELERTRDEILKTVYEQYPRVLPKKGGVKIDF
ncbi:MAG: hypothetical protein AAB656_04105 [Patescibacteria group bacterium]